MVNALLAYGTRNGATADTAEEIAKVLRDEGITVTVVNLKDEKEGDITGYNLVVVGSGIQMGKWTGEAEGFLGRHHTGLKLKKLALFVSSMTQTTKMGEAENDEVKAARVKYIDSEIAKYSLSPISTGLFGGVLDFSKMSWIFKKIMEKAKPDMEVKGIKETRPGFYDTRDFDSIRAWAKDLAAKVSAASA